ncbi:hypothetical protein C1645_819558 [Glomus cerebriforme]|uniref:Uncharacterized protein n=1 Tax=Glomus cerebriforme TaxID=658196 RepID=A0A397T4T8_9GLOM|nr:hypothetical protein C1645_819558 [Glomus cerebriforme]
MTSINNNTPPIAEQIIIEQSADFLQSKGLEERNEQQNPPRKTIEAPPKVLEKEAVEGAFTIESEEEIFIDKPVSEKNAERELVKRLEELEILREEVKDLENEDKLSQQAIINLQCEVAGLEKKLSELEKDLEEEKRHSDKLDSQIDYEYETSCFIKKPFLKEEAEKEVFLLVGSDYLAKYKYKGDKELDKELIAYFSCSGIRGIEPTREIEKPRAYIIYKNRQTTSVNRDKTEIMQNLIKSIKEPEKRRSLTSIYFELCFSNIDLSELGGDYFFLQSDNCNCIGSPEEQKEWHVHHIKKCLSDKNLLKPTNPTSPAPVGYTPEQIAQEQERQCQAQQQFQAQEQEHQQKLQELEQIKKEEGNYQKEQEQENQNNNPNSDNPTKQNNNNSPTQTPTSDNNNNNNNQENQSPPPLNLTPEILSKFKSLKNLNTKEKLEALINPVKDNPDFEKELSEKQNITDLNSLLVNKTPKEIIILIKRFE